MLIAIGNCIFTWKALCHIMTSKWFLLLMRKLHPGKCPLAICLVFIFLLFQLLQIIGNMQICTEFFIMPAILLSGCFFWNSLLGGGLVWWCRVPNYVAICSQNLISKSFLEILTLLQESKVILNDITDCLTPGIHRFMI